MARRRNGKPAAVSASPDSSRPGARSRRDIEQDIEELGALLHGQEVGGEVGWFDPQLIARSTWARHRDGPRRCRRGPRGPRGAGEPAVAIEQARSVGEWCPTEAFELGVEGQMDAYIEVVGVGQVVGRMASPRPRHHQVAVVAQPSRRALRPAAVAACVDPMRSADRIRSRSSSLWPSARASEVTVRR